MKRLIVLITGLQVLAHSVFGCCAHVDLGHAECPASGHCHHAADSAPCEIAHQHDVGPAGEQVASLPAAGESQKSHPRPPHQCPHDSCQWIVQKDAQQTGQVILVAYLPATAQAASCITSPPLGIFRAAPPPASAPPVRLHLWVGVLLI